MHVCAPQISGACEAGREHQLSQNWSYSSHEVSCACRELNLGPQDTQCSQLLSVFPGLPHFLGPPQPLGRGVELHTPLCIFVSHPKTQKSFAGATSTTGRAAPRVGSPGPSYLVTQLLAAAAHLFGHQLSYSSS